MSFIKCRTRRLAASMALVGLVGAGIVAAQETPLVVPATLPTTEPSAGPATQPSVSTTTITPEAEQVLSQVSAAYASLKSLELAGTLTGDIDAGGRKQNQSVRFTDSFQAPNKFRHALQEEFIAGSTGQKAYSYVKSRNMYLSTDAPADRVDTQSLPQPLPQVLSMQDPSLMLAIAKSPRQELTENVQSISTEPDTKLNDVPLQTLVLKLSDQSSIRLMIDSNTHLIRQSRADLSAMMVAHGVPDVKVAAYVVDYTTIAPDAPMKDEQFAWAAPEGARDLAAAAAPEEQDSAALALAGKPAPDFKLAGMDGKAVSPADLKGSVYILDFWATWCGPCRKSLPHLNELYDNHKAAGLKVFAVNSQEEKDKVQKFITETKLTIPVLLDTNGDATQSYKADAIPETVLVGKDGKVLKVLVGGGPENAKALEDAVAAALK